MKKILAVTLLVVSLPAAADVVTRCYPVATNVNGEIMVTQKCDSFEMPHAGTAQNFDGNTNYKPNMSAYGVALPDGGVVGSAARGTAYGQLYSRVPFSWVFIR